MVSKRATFLLLGAAWGPGELEATRQGPAAGMLALFMPMHPLPCCHRDVECGRWDLGVEAEWIVVLHLLHSAILAPGGA